MNAVLHGLHNHDEAAKPKTPARLAMNPPCSRHRPRAFAAWLMIVFLLGVLAPGISVALAQARGDPSGWQDVCRAPTAASQGQPSQLAEPGGAGLKLLTQGHCAACHLGHVALATPPVHAHLAVRGDLAQELLERSWTAPVPAHAWRPASARAPPRLI